MYWKVWQWPEVGDLATEVDRWCRWRRVDALLVKILVEEVSGANRFERGVRCGELWVFGAIEGEGLERQL